MLSVEENGAIKFCFLEPSHINVLSTSRALQNGLAITKVRVRGMRVSRGCQLRLENVRISSAERLYSHAGGHSLTIDADTSSKVVEIKDKQEISRPGTYRPIPDDEVHAVRNLQAREPALV